MNCLYSGAITRIGGAQKRAGGVVSVKYSSFAKKACNFENCNHFLKCFTFMNLCGIVI